MPTQKLDSDHSLKILAMESSQISTNNSHQELVSDSDSVENINTNCAPINVKKCSTSIGNSGISVIQTREWITVTILCFVNLINYMDRFTLAGILTDIEDYYNIGNDEGGLLSTVFVISYMIFAPLFGYLGDRYDRKLIMAAGVFLWSLTTLLGSFMTNFYAFLCFRMLVGIGEASYSTIAPTIISDMFVKDIRSRMLALFYFAIPVGSGLGYIIGAQTASALGSWQWGLRVTPILGVIAVLLILFVLKEPIRGEAEGTTNMVATSWSDDLKALSKNYSFILSTAGFTCVAFVTGALAWWGPTYIYKGLQVSSHSSGVTLESVAFQFGVITMLSGIIGVPLGSILGQELRKKYPRSDAIICAVGLLVSAPFMVAGMLTVEYNLALCFTMMFCAELSLNLNWAIVADILLYVVIPTRRSTAEAFQILISHALGDAGSPYLVGAVSEMLKRNMSPNATELTTTKLVVSPEVEFKSMQYALFTTCFVEVLGGLFFLLTAIYIVKDKAAADRAIDQDQPRHFFAEDANSDSDQRRNLVT